MSNRLTNKDIFTLYIQLGSFTKLKKYIDKETEYYFGDSTLKQKVWDFLVENYPEAVEIVQEIQPQWSLEEIEQTAVYHAYQQYVRDGLNREYYEKWLDKYNITDPKYRRVGIYYGFLPR